MHYKRRILEATLDSVKLNITGAGKPTKAQHLVTTLLRYPRPAIAEKVTARTLELDKGSVDLSKAGWDQRILFKEVVQGPFSLGIDVTESLTRAQAGKLAAAIASSLFKLAGGQVVDAVEGTWATGLFKTPFDTIRDAISSMAKTNPRIVGSGSIDLCADKDWKPGTVRKIRIPLTAVCDIDRVRRKPSGGSMTTSRKKIIKAGAANGVAEISVRTYD